MLRRALLTFGFIGVLVTPLVLGSGCESSGGASGGTDVSPSPTDALGDIDAVSGGDAALPDVTASGDGAASSEDAAAPGGDSVAVPEDVPAVGEDVAAPTGDGLTVHEWGTFTSFVGSTGGMVEGVQHAEEELPSFVGGRDIGAPGSGAAETLPEGVTQKLQTPVLHFYADHAIPLTVRIDLPTAIPSRWWPPPATFAPAEGAATALAGGLLEWELTVEPAASAGPAVSPDSLLAPIRDVPSTPVVVGDVSERFAFYQTLGRFELPVRAGFLPSGEIEVANDSDQDIPAAYLVHVHAGGGLILDFGDLPAGTSKVRSPTPKELNMDVYSEEAGAMLSSALVAAGLTTDEANALVGTWSHNTFHTFGLRVLYVAPRSFVDLVAPITITPAPEALERVYVGRVEVLSPEEEQAVVATVVQAAGGAQIDPVETLGVFAEPKLRRALELLTDPAQKAACEALIAVAAAAP